MHVDALELLLPALPDVQAALHEVREVSRVRDARFGVDGSLVRVSPTTLLATFDDGLGGSAIFDADDDAVLVCATCR